MSLDADAAQVCQLSQYPVFVLSSGNGPVSVDPSTAATNAGKEGL